MLYIPPQQAEAESLPPVPSFIPLANFPKVIPVKPTVEKPAPFAQPSLPVKPQVQSVPRFEAEAQSQEFTGDEYLPPALDVRSAVPQGPDFETFMVKLKEFCIKKSLTPSMRFSRNTTKIMHHPRKRDIDEQSSRKT